MKKILLMFVFLFSTSAFAVEKRRSISEGDQLSLKISKSLKQPTLVQKKINACVKKYGFRVCINRELESGIRLKMIPAVLRNVDAEGERLVYVADFESLEHSDSGAVGKNLRQVPERFFSLSTKRISPPTPPMTCLATKAGKKIGKCTTTTLIELMSIETKRM